MALPGVSIIVADGALGRTVATDDGVGGLIVTGVAASGLALNVAAVVFSLAEAVALGITEATHAHAHGQISDYYGQAGTGAELWLMLVAETTTAAAVFVADTGPMQVLLNASHGKITIAATSMGRASGYTPTVTGLLDYDLSAVAGLAQLVANVQAAKFSPVRIILDGTYLINPLSGTATMKGAGANVAVFLGVTTTGKRAASMGRFLGRLAAIPVHESIARVKTGNFSANGALTSGLALSTYSEGQINTLHVFGYMAVRSFQGLQGVFITDDLTLAAATSDFTSIARGRVMDKAVRLAYQTYVYELNDTIEVTDEGKLLPTKVSYIEDVIDRALRTRMLAEGNCSAVSVTVDPDQNVIATDTLEVVVKITPLGYLKSIIVKLGFYNPAS